MLNALTFDIEDYFHVHAFSDVIEAEQWSGFELRVVRNTQRILEILDDHKIKATFFVLGWVAEQAPGLIAEIADADHEIASHGYSHKLVFNQELAQFKRETERSKKLLEDITGNAVKGYRASTYSITRKSMWALDVLVELGFMYDSSIYPVNHDVYGIPGAERHIHRLATSNGKSIVEFPIATKRMFGKTIPVGGGGYFRLFPYWFTKYSLKTEYENKHPFIFYLHPWEFDPDQPRIKNAPLLSRFRHYNNIAKTESRLSRLLADFKFDTVNNVLHLSGQDY